MQTHVIANLFERSGVDKRSDAVNPRPQAGFCQTSGNPNKVLLVDSLIEIGGQLSSTSELTDLWKANQGQIDDLKNSEPELFKRLKDGFAQLKTNLKED